MWRETRLRVRDWTHRRKLDNTDHSPGPDEYISIEDNFLSHTKLRHSVQKKTTNIMNANLIGNSH